MPFQSLTIPGGLSRLATEYNNEGRWFEAEKVRFRDDRPEPIGGWEARDLTGELVGICRKKHTWRSNAGFIYEAFGTTQGLFVRSDSTIYDITPIRLQFAAETNPLSIVSGTSTLTVVVPTAHSAEVGERVELQDFDLTAQGISDAELNKAHFISAVPDPNTVQIELDETASATISGGGGTGDVNFLQKPGAEGTVFGGGWSAGFYGFGTYGTPRDVQVAQSRARVYSLDNWGEILVGTFRGSTPVKWDPVNDGVSVRATEIPNCPKADFLLVSSPDRHLVLFGTQLPGETEINRLAVRWSDQEDFTEWNVTATTTAGSQLLSEGSEILAARLTSRQIIIWTDIAIASMQFIGPPFTFGFQTLDYSPEIVSRNSPVEVDGTVMWMGVGAFYVYDGVARVLPCPIKDLVFRNYNLNQKEKFFGAINQQYNEIWWFFVEEGESEVSRYVTFDYVRNQWSTGRLVRTTWEDSNIQDFPSATSPEGVIFDHERGTSADGEPLNAYCETAPIDIGEGDELMYVKGIIPDAIMEGADTMQIILKGRRYPQGPETVYGPYTISESTQRIRTRLRVRQLTFRYESNSTLLFWQGGKPRIDIKPQGKY